MSSSKDDGSRRSGEDCKAAVGFLERSGVIGEMVGAECNVEDSFSKMIGGVVRVISMEKKGHLSCTLNVKPPMLNGHGILLGAVAAAVAERVAIGCAKSIFGQHSHFNLREITISYLSPAPPNAEVVVDAHVIGSDGNLTVVAVNFRLKESQRLAYVSRATLHQNPLSNL